MIPSPLALERINALMPIVVSGRSVATLEGLVTRFAEPLLGTVNGLSVERSQASDRTKDHYKPIPPPPAPVYLMVIYFVVSGKKIGANMESTA